MKIRYLLYIVLWFLVAGSCSKIDLSEEKGDEKPGSSENGGDGSSPGIDQNACYTVAELSSLADHAEVVVGGYIVGFVAGNSISKTMFTAEGAVESNIVIADSPLERECSRCAPMQLVKNTSPRNDLNLAAHPENLGKFVVMSGVKDKYYYAPGLKPVKDYAFAEVDNPEQPSEPDLRPSVYPVLHRDAPPRVMEGH